MNERVNLEIYRLEVIKGKMGKADGLEKKRWEKDKDGQYQNFSDNQKISGVCMCALL